MSTTIKGIVSAMRTWHDDSWDDICDCCGMCCYEREVDECGDVAVDLSAPCEFLDESTRRCSVYENRFDKCERCCRLTPRIALFGDHLPPSCAYVRAFRR